MQDRTIDNALQALRKQGGHQGKLAEVLLEMRGVGWAGWVHDRPFKRGETKHLVLNALQGGPRSSWALGKLIQQAVPGLGDDAADNRAYQALRRLRDKGLVRRDDNLWSLL